MSSNLNDTNTNGKLRSFEKNRYFHGKLMTARDMLAEQDYHTDRQKATNRYVTGTGVACGLGVTEVKQDGDELTASLKPGFALDGFGDPIVVTGSDPVEVRVRHPEYPSTAQPNVPSSEAIYLYLTYDECSIETVPKPGAENACKEECTYNRILEVFDVVYEEVEGDPEDGRPKGYKSVPDVTFPDPGDVSEENGAISPEDPGLVKMARKYYAANLSERAEDSHPWIFLGAFANPNGDGEWKRIDLEHPEEPLVYTNDFLYAGIARHTADFHNPHQVTLDVTPSEEVEVPAGADAFLSSGRSHEQGQVLFFDGRAVVESITQKNVEDTDSAERTFSLHEVSEANEIESPIREIEVDDAGRALIDDTENLEGDYVLLYSSGETDDVVHVNAVGIGSVRPGFLLRRRVRNAKFRVVDELPSDENGESWGIGAKVRIRDDESPGGAIDFSSSNHTVSIDALPREEETPSEIDLTISLEQIAAEIAAIRTLNGVDADEDRNVELESDTIDITPDVGNNRIALETPPIDAIETLEGVGADDGGNVELESSTLTITTEPDDSRITLEAPEIPDDIDERLSNLEHRVTRIEQYQIHKTIHCKYTSYSVVQEKFEEFEDGRGLELVENILGETELAIEKIEEIGDLDPRMFIEFIDAVWQSEEELVDVLWELANEGVITPGSARRYQRAFSALESIERDEENVSQLAAAQDCLAKAAEWLQPQRHV